MNNKFDELAKDLARSATCALLCLAVVAHFAWAAGDPAA